MRSLLGLAFLGLALAQSLVLPAEGEAGQPLTVEGRDLPPGRFPLQVVGPRGPESLEVEVEEGRFQLPFTPKTPGTYRFRLLLPGQTLEGEVTVKGQVEPVLTPEGLRLGETLLPLPGGAWVGPLVQGEKVYLAQGLLVLEVAGGKVQFHFAPARVLALRPGPEAVLEGERSLPIPFPPLPFMGQTEDLRALAPLLEALKPPKPWPYFAYWALDPGELSPEDLEAYGQSLKERGHAPELLFAQEGVRRMAQRAQALLQENPEQALRLTQALFRHTPLFPGSLAFFQEMAQGLEAQGREAEALGLREGLKALKAWLPPYFAPLEKGVWGLGLAYLLLMLYFLLRYLPAQVRETRAIGGVVLGFFRHPLLRLRHLLPAYLSPGERLLAFLLLLLTGLGLLGLGLDQKVRQTLYAPPWNQGSLRTEGAQEGLLALPATPGVKALQAYALWPEDPAKAKGLLERARAWPFVEALKGNWAKALALDPYYGPLQGSLGLGEDAWGPRAAAPRLKEVYRAFLEVELLRLQQDPLRGFLGLPLPFAEGYRAWFFLGLILLLVYHLLGFLLPKRPSPKGRYALLLHLLFPGSLAYGGGVGLIPLFLLAYGLLLYLQGGDGLLAIGLAYALHLPFYLAHLVGLRR